MTEPTKSPQLLHALKIITDVLAPLTPAARARVLLAVAILKLPKGLTEQQVIEFWKLGQGE